MTKTSAMPRLLWLLLASASAALAASPASAICSSSKSLVFFLAFPEGSAAVPEEREMAFLPFMMTRTSAGEYVESYYVLASGDIREGADWDQAPEERRTEDKKLGEARVAAIRAMLGRQPEAIRAATVDSKVRENRQVFTEEQLAADPELSQDLNAGILATVRTRTAPPKKGEPVPVC